jgi:hypothetical protein
MSNEKPLKLDMSFTQALQMIAKGGKPTLNSQTKGNRNKTNGVEKLAKKGEAKIKLKKV